MVYSITAEHMQLTEIWQTQQKLQFSDYEVPQLLQNIFGTIAKYQAPLASFAKAANAYNLYQLRITPSMVVVKRYAQQLEADLKKSAQASMITLNCQQGIDEECI